MRTAIQFFAISLMLTLTAGCASQSKHPMTTDCANDPAYTPPGSMNIAITDASSRSNNAGAKTSAEAMPQPNKREVQKHSIRAAMSMY